jgi:hypothetical protein
MTEAPPLTDRLALARNRTRALALPAPATFLHDLAIDEVKERLETVNRTFTDVAVVTGFPALWQRAFPAARVVEDAETLALKPGAQDLVIHALALHWANDPVGPDRAMPPRPAALTGCSWAFCSAARPCTNCAPPWPRPRPR